MTPVNVNSTQQISTPATSGGDYMFTDSHDMVVGGGASMSKSAGISWPMALAVGAVALVVVLFIWKRRK